MSLGKVAPHTLEDTDPGEAWWRVANAVKAVDNPWLLAEAKAHNPQIITVHRHFFPSQFVWRHGADVAREAIASCNGFVPDFIELFNEIAHTPELGLYRHWEMCGEARPIILSYGSELAALSLGTGWMEQVDWEYVKAKGYYGLRVISLHEYWNGAGFDDWNAFRHSRIDRWLGADHPLRWLITECGRDRLQSSDGRGWIEQGVTRERYVAEIMDYGAVIDTEPKVIAAFPFCNGSTPPHDGEPGFLGFEMDTLVPRLLEIGTPRRRLWTPIVEGKGEANNMPVYTKTTIAGLEVVNLRERYPFVGGSYPIRPLKDIAYAVVHHSATRTPVEDNTNGPSVALLDSIDLYHREHNSWPCIAYHFAIDGDGTIFWLNGLAVVGWHSGPGNALGVGVVLLGNYETSSPPAAMVTALAKLFAALQRELGRPLRLLGHRDFMSTTCPGAHWPVTRQRVLDTLSAPTAPVGVPQSVRDAAEGHLHVLWALDERTHAGVIKIKTDLEWPA